MHRQEAEAYNLRLLCSRRGRRPQGTVLFRLWKRAFVAVQVFHHPLLYLNYSQI